ncbi:MAG: amidohydrolase family protein [Sandaracinaceae bacterium]
MRTRLTDSKYFEEKEGRVQLVDGLGPICDVHTHLALTYVPSGDVDLERNEIAELYLDENIELDLDAYMNRNFDETALSRMKKDLSIGSLRDDGMRATHTAPALEQQMKETRVARSVILAIDLPHTSRNTESYVTVADGREGLIPAAAIHPYAPRAEALLRKAHARGARALKMHPAVQMMRPDHPKAMRLYEVCGELGMPVMWHCGPVGITSDGADARCHIKHYWQPIHELPDTTFILGHSGALMYEMGVKLACMYDNVYVEIASQGIPAIRHILNTVPSERVMNGSDFPFYHQGTSVLKLLEATEGNEPLRRKALWENAATLYGFEA